VGWPRPPLLLGLVLGPLAENKLFLSTDNYGLAWLARPGVLILLAIMLAGILVPVINARKRRRAAPAGGVTPSPSPGARFDRVTAFSVAMAVVAAWGLWEGRHFGPRAGLFPWAVGIPTLVLAIVQLARDFTGRRPAPQASEEEPAPDVPSEVARRRTAMMFAWIVGYLVGIWLLGFSLATLAMSFFYLKAGREGWVMTVVLSLFNFAFIYGIFELGLAVPFPPGELFVWLGLAGSARPRDHRQRSVVYAVRCRRVCSGVD
jgi:hypothetical protein